MAECGDPGGSLVVLPEGFNKGRPYGDLPWGQPKITRADALGLLVALAASQDVAFVAGLLDPPFSAAYWVDGNNAVLMRHKAGADQTGNYVPCAKDCDSSNPIETDDMVIGALICNDIQLPDARRLAASIDGSARTRKAICIPACMEPGWFGSGPLTYDHWKRKCVVVANSNAAGCGSFISSFTGEREIFAEPRNRVVLKRWDQLGVGGL